MAITGTETPDIDMERQPDDAGLFGIDLGYQDDALEVVDSTVVSAPPRKEHVSKTLTDCLAEAAAHRVRWRQSHENAAH